MRRYSNRPRPRFDSTNYNPVRILKHENGSPEEPKKLSWIDKVKSLIKQAWSWLN